jgi:nucleotide-binding universal stress UspA family protein
MNMKLLVAHDGSEQSDKALDKAASLALLSKGSVVVLSVVPDLCMMELSDNDCKQMYKIMTEESEKKLNTTKDDLSKKGIEIETVVKFGNAAETIIKTCNDRNIDMIVIGSHGRHGAKKFLLGSVSSKVVDHSPCDVLVVK